MEKSQLKGKPLLNAFHHFCNKHLPLFNSKSSQIDANSWIDQLEKIFCVVSCAEKEKVEFVAYKLLKVANAWWKATREFLQQDLGESTHIMWVRFMEVFFKRLFPLFVREAKAREFIKLK